MPNELLPGSLLGKRKKKKELNPNPLFSQWLAEWRDEAKEKGWKSEYIYSRALNSLKKYPLPLSTGKECKILQNFGDKICKMIDDRLLKHRQEQEISASSKNFDTGIPSVSSIGTTLPRLQPTTVHEISDSSDEDNGSLQNNRPSVHGHSSKVKTINGTTSTSTTERTFQEKKSFDHVFSRQKVGPGSGNALVIAEADEGVSFLGRTSPVTLSSSDDDDNFLPELSTLPALEKGGQKVVTEGETSSVRTSSTDRMEDIGPAVAVDSVRVTHTVNDSDGDEAGQIVPPQRPGGRAGGRQPREYVPAYRSGPYAVLLALFRQAQDPNFRGFMTKAELCRAAQPLADKSFTVPDPGGRYTAWSSVSALIKKGYLTKESSPAKYRLTDEGYELAYRLEEVEGGRRVAGVGDHPEGEADAATRRSDGMGSEPFSAADCGKAAPHPVARKVKKTSQRNSSVPREDPDTSPFRTTEPAPGSFTTGDTHDVASAGEALPVVPESRQCILVEDDDADKDDSDNELPALTLPSLAQRLKPSSSTSSSPPPSGSGESSGNRQLQYWYVDGCDDLVTRKDQACVEIDEGGVSFLVKINYQHLLQSGCQYRLDMTRPLGDDFVFAFLSDANCYEESQPPQQKSSIVIATTTTTALPESTEVMRSSTTSLKSRRAHDISESDSEGEVSSRPDIKLSNSGRDSSLSHTNKTRPAGVSCSRPPSKGGQSHPPAGPLNHREKTAAPAVTLDAGVSKFQKVPSFSSYQGSEDSGKSVTSSPVEDFVLRPGTFEVVLCVDNREFYGSQSSSKSLLPDLVRNGVTCDLRLLNVGDLLWVAREKMVPPPGEQPLVGSDGQLQPVRRELVLNYVVERKRMDDLVSSMIGGRLKEQKFRLKHSGLQEKIILIESYGSMQHFSISEDRIKQAIANSEIIDGFTVKQTSDAKETAAYLTLMTRYLQSHYQNKTLRSCSRETIKELGIRFDISDTEQMLMPFNHFNQASLKNKPLTVTELFAKQLIQLWGMSAEKARAVVDRYPTPTRLFEAYDACMSEKERESLLANLKYGKNLRNLGIALSRQVAQLYTTRMLT